MRISSTRSRARRHSLWLSCLFLATSVSIASAQQAGPGVLPGTQPFSAGGAFSGPLLAPTTATTCAAPQYSWQGNTTAGLVRLGANNIAGCANGATIFDWNASRVLFAQPIYIADGTVSLPSVSFGTTTTLGLYKQDASTVGIGLTGAPGNLWAATVSAGIFDVGRTNDITLSRLTTGQLKILQDSTHGVALDVATDGTAKLLSRAGADTAIFKTSVAIIPSTQSGVYKMYSVDGFSTLYSKISSAADGVIDFSESAGAKKVALTVPTGTGNTLAVLTAAPAESATKTGNFTAISYTPASTAGTYRVDGVITTTSSTNTGTVQLTVDFVDSQGTTHTADIIPLVDAAGVIATTKTGASKTYSAVSKMISINNAGTAIALKVVITGSVSYTVSGSIEKIQ